MRKLGAREVTGTVVRGIVDELRERQIFDEVRARVPPAAAQAMDKPGMILAWHKSEITDAILEATKAARGRDAVRAMGLSVMTGRGIGALLRPLLDLWLRFSDAGPAALYSRLDAAATILMKGIGFEWIERGTHGGTVRMFGEEPAPDANWALWEGVLEYAFVLTKTLGTVDHCRVSEGGCVCEIDVSWT
jgi:hypothetical protein